MGTKAIVFQILAGVCIALSIMELAFVDTFALTELYWQQLSWLPHYWLATFEYIVGIVFVYLGYRSNPGVSHKFIETYGRLGLGFMFIGASIFKIQDPKAFAVLTAQYQILPSFALNFFSLLLPIVELIIGVLIIVSNKTRESAAMILAMMIMFIAALSYAVAMNLGITCGCFELDGAMDKNQAWISLVRDIVLLPVLIYLTTRPNNRYIWKVWSS